jgi:hypothetical protein
VRLEDEFQLPAEVPGEGTSSKDDPGDERPVVRDVQRVREALGVAGSELAAVHGGFKKHPNLLTHDVRVPAGVLTELGISELELEEREVATELVGRAHPAGHRDEVSDQGSQRRRVSASGGGEAFLDADGRAGRECEEQRALGAEALDDGGRRDPGLARNVGERELTVLYDTAKAATARMAFGMAQELRDYRVASIALALGHLSVSETPRYGGRAIAALAPDPDVLAKSGELLTAGGLARESGFTDVDGTQPEPFALPAP